MDQTLLLAMIVAASFGIVATLWILRRERRIAAAGEAESPFGVSTEGEKRCPSCGMGNLWTDRNCVSCGGRLPG